MYTIAQLCVALIKVLDKLNPYYAYNLIILCIQSYCKDMSQEQNDYITIKASTCIYNIIVNLLNVLLEFLKT